MFQSQQVLLRMKDLVSWWTEYFLSQGTMWCWSCVSEMVSNGVLKYGGQWVQSIRSSGGDSSQKGLEMGA